MPKINTKPKPPSVELTTEIISNGIVKIKRRISEIENFDISTIQKKNGANIEALLTKINTTIAEIFGYDTIEYQLHYINNFLEAQKRVIARPDSINIVREKYSRGLEDAAVKMKSLIEILEEKFEDIGQQIESMDELYDFWIDIHPKIVAISKSRFESGHPADAVESAFKEINSCIKDIVLRITGNELDGSSLMKTAFSPKNPIIVFDDLSTETGKSIQLGYMEIFAGAMTGIRNPKAHDNINITKKRAKHFLYLASLLMHKIDEKI